MYWTDEEDAELIRRHGHEPISAIAKSLGRTYTAVAKRASQLHLTKPHPNPKNHQTKTMGWSNEEIKFLKQHYKSRSMESIAQELGRSVFSVQSQARDMGVLRPNLPDEYVDYIRRRRRDGAKDAQIAREIGRSKTCVYLKRRKYQIDV